ncbi:MAG: tetratricopeptide repeat protein [Magnetococcales bacterium]|nr:tetratricopeptide repeat protein [Magnetococcales bacterium]
MPLPTDWWSELERLMDAGRAEEARRLLAMAHQAGWSGATPERLAILGEEQARLIRLFEAGRWPELITEAAGQLAQRPGDGFVRKALGTALLQQNRLAEADALLLEAVAILPEDVELLITLGVTRWRQNLLEDAETLLRHALARHPGHVAALFNLANLLNARGDADGAIAAWQEVIRLDARHGQAHFNLFTRLLDLGRIDDAALAYRQALASGTLPPGAQLLGELMLPRIPTSQTEIDHWRERFREGIARLEAQSGEPGWDALHREASLSFYLAYHDRCDRDLIVALNRMLRARAPVLVHHAPLQTLPRPGERRIRVGFVSRYLNDHTIGRLNEGWLRHLDRSRFEVTLFHAPGARNDPFRTRLDALADAACTLPQELDDQRRTIAAAAPDLLFYPEVGMSPAVHHLAHARLAPVQVVGWGHPDTTGLPTVDYFLSSALIEPEGAEAHYSERLIRLHRLPCCYPVPELPAKMPTQAELGVPEHGRIYACPQTQFKLHPAFDRVLSDIATGDPDGCIVLLEWREPSWTGLLRARWAKSHPLLPERVRFLPLLPREHYLALLAQVDVLLDPIHFGSGNTFYEAMAVGTPVVTWPGRFMRGRIVAGGYRQMEIAAPPVAKELADYAPLALAFAHDEARRLAFTQEVAGKRASLFDDRSVVREFASFLQAAVAAAGAGTRLPEGWRPPQGRAG